MEQYEIIDPGSRSLVLPNAKLLTLGKDFAWLEGPVWFADANQLLVSGRTLPRQAPEWPKRRCCA
jgi:gluconolactonase